MQNEKFNLVDDSWIPIAGNGFKSLHDVFADPSLHRIGGNAIDKIVILRLLLMITHATVEIPNAFAWRKLTTAEISQKVTAYLQDHHDEFYLYGERPFFQFPELKNAKAKTMEIDDFEFKIATETNVVLSQWSLADNEIYTDAEKALYSLIISCYSKASKSTMEIRNSEHKNWGQSILLGKKGRQHCFVLGDALLETIKCNLLTENEILYSEEYPNGIGKPFWEISTDKLVSEDFTKTYLGKLLPITKKILFTSENYIYIQDGLNYNIPDRECIDPAIVFNKDLIPNELTENTYLWRELPSVLNFLNTDLNKNAYILAQYREKIKENIDINYIQIFTAGVSVLNNAGEQKVTGERDYMYSEFFIPTKHLGKNGFIVFYDAIGTLERYKKHLYDSIKNYLKIQKVTNKKICKNACDLFWELMEPHAQELLNCAFGEENPQEKLQLLLITYRKIIENIYDKFCPNNSPRQMKAWIKYRPFSNIIKKYK